MIAPMIPNSKAPSPIARAGVHLVFGSPAYQSNASPLYAITNHRFCRGAIGSPLVIFRGTRVVVDYRSAVRDYLGVRTLLGSLRSNLWRIRLLASTVRSGSRMTVGSP